MQASFLEDLRTMLHKVEKADNRKIFSWDPSGKRFDAGNRDLFSANINIFLQCFRMLSYSTFQRVLETWGFHKRDQCKISGEDYFSHPLFVRDDSSRCKNLTIQEMKQAGTNAGSRPQSTCPTEESRVIITSSDLKNTTASGCASEQHFPILLHPAEELSRRTSTSLEVSTSPPRVGEQMPKKGRIKKLLARAEN
jgi:hypothetical protein